MCGQRSKRYAQPNFSGSPQDQERHQTVQAHRAQDQREDAEKSGEPRKETFLRREALDLLILSMEIDYR